MAFSFNPGGGSIQLFVTTTESSPVTFIVNATGFNFSGVATPNSSTNVALPRSLQVDSGSDRNKGIHVKAEGNKRITVYGLNYGLHTSDAFLALPCNRLPIDEYEYYAVTYQPLVPHPSTILIVACEDNTEVSTGPSSSVTLNRLETYMMSSILNDLTGRRITATKPIAFFSNHECANVPVGIGYCDHLTEQIPPTSTWGHLFLAASLLGRRSGELFRIITSQPPATVTINCTTFLQPISYSLTATVNWQEFEITPNSFCSITSTSPILVAQFSLGTLRVPVEQFSNYYVFNVLPTFAFNYITVYVAPEYFQTDRIFVDNTSLDNFPWSQIYCSGNIICGYITRVNVTTAGVHQLHHLDQTARVGISAYGFGVFNSYGYPGGLKLTPVQCKNLYTVASSQLRMLLVNVDVYTPVATVSFSSTIYKYAEGTGGAQVTVTRSGNTEAIAIVLVASDNFQGTAAGNRQLSL